MSTVDCRYRSKKGGMTHQAQFQSFRRNSIIYFFLLQFLRIWDFRHIVRLLEWSPDLYDEVAIPQQRLVEDAVSAVCHAIATSLIGRIGGTRIEGMYYWNPFNIISALCGFKGMACNAIVLAVLASPGARRLQWLLLGLYAMVDLGQMRWMMGPIIQTMVISSSRKWDILGLCMAFLKRGDALGSLRNGSRSFETIQPTVDLHWYLMAQVFPSFRKYFSQVIVLMGLLMSFGMCIRFRGRQNLVLMFACHGILCTLLNTTPSASMCALWMGLVLSLEKGNTAPVHVLVLAFCIVTGMNATAYQLWIQYNVGNANFFYGMNILLAAVAGLLLVQLLKAAHS
eukprot:jgi/Picre1/35099/NNA_002562.t1